MARALILIVATWFGSLLTVCAIVAPSLFAVLPDRTLAGSLAGHFFAVESWLSLAFGGVALVLLARIPAQERIVDLTLIGVGALLPIGNELLLRPWMERARDAGDLPIFAALHGVGASLFVVAGLSTLALAWRLTRSVK